jgi:translation elongation factor EF-G
MYQNFIRVIENANVIMATYKDELLGDVTVYPEKGTVAFSAGLQGWAFTLSQFARMYAEKFGVDKEKMAQRLWGDNYFDPESKKWITNGTSASGKSISRAFCKFILEPIGQIFQAAMSDNLEKLDKMLKSIGISLNTDERNLQGKRLLKCIMQKWLPADKALMEMMVLHLPSPAKAQRYRVEKIFILVLKMISLPQQSETVIQRVLLLCTFPRWCLLPIRVVSLLLEEFLPEQLSLDPRSEFWDPTTNLERRKISRSRTFKELSL